MCPTYFQMFHQIICLYIYIYTYTKERKQADVEQDDSW